MDRISIRTAHLGDLPAVTEIFRLASLSNEGDRQNLVAHPEFLEMSDRGLIDERVRLAEMDGGAIGFATTQQAGRALELEDLFVHPDWMRRGVATRLIEDVIERGRLAGVSRVEVTANPHALAFYRHVGFRGDEQIETAFEPGTRMYLPVPARRTSTSSTGE